MRGEHLADGVINPAASGSPPRAWGTLSAIVLAILYLRFTPTCVGNTSYVGCRSYRVPVHPHVRGEHAFAPPRRWRFDGSPPRAWGTRQWIIHDIGDTRFTPTCVGNTSPRGDRAQAVAVHPHVRGEHGVAAIRALVLGGSPPRAWGTRRTVLLQHRSNRFTPTCVGNTRSLHLSSALLSVHPHVRGEHQAQPVTQAALYGSPPRAWGPRAFAVAGDQIRRFTPTCVGNTSEGLLTRGAPSVHPHVRGEHRTRRTSRTGSSGSPPRAWGTPLSLPLSLSLVRFTPTCVGNTFSRQARLECLRGSPPRAWGTHVPLGRAVNIVRFTPTCVGNTRSGSGSAKARSVHPHVRGEHCQRRYRRQLRCGSPPRAWGTHFPPGPRPLKGRFTPTCVGNTWLIAAAPAAHPVHPHVRGEHPPTPRHLTPHIGSPPRAWGTPRSAAVVAL